MKENESLKVLHEAIERIKSKSYSETLEELRQWGTVDEKGEVIVRMPVGPSPNAKKKKKKRSEES